jgi:signal transduction histidine kinase
MNQKNEQITLWIALIPIFAVIITAVFTANTFINQIQTNTQNRLKKLETLEYLKIKEDEKERVNRIFKRLDHIQKSHEARILDNIKSFTDHGYNILKTIYENNKEQSKEKIEKLYTTALKDLRFFENKTGYYFVLDMKGKLKFRPANHKIEKMNILNKKDSLGNYFVKDFIKVAKTVKEGFLSWQWEKPGGTVPKDKIGYIKYFEPLGIIIGTARYTEDIKELVKKESQDFLLSFNDSNEGYFFAVTYDGTVISHIKKEIIGKNLWNKKINGEYLARNIIKTGKKSNGGYLQYTASKNPRTNKQEKKISYIKDYPEFGWIIGTGVYRTELNDFIYEQQLKLQDETRNITKKTILYIFVITLFILIIMFIITRRLGKIFKTYENDLLKKQNYLEQQVQTRTKELHKLNQHLEQKIQIAVEENRKKDKMLQEQAKLAAMGEMIGAIAHQWRQPLNTLSIRTQNLREDYEEGLLDKKFINDFISKNKKTIEFMSNTINDFQNFFRINKHRSDFSVERSIKSVLTIQDAQLKNKKIKIVFKGEDFLINGFESEFKQVILNILNNAQDAVTQNSIENGEIKISLKNNTVEISDNAGGIPENIIERIFEPYFTTKEQGKGTGIGLYMSKMIIEDNMKGSLSVRNLDNGALFSIKLKS